MIYESLACTAKCVKLLKEDLHFCIFTGCSCAKHEVKNSGSDEVFRLTIMIRSCKYKFYIVFASGYRNIKEVQSVKKLNGT